MFKKHISFLLSFVIFSSCLSATPPPTIHAEGAILIEPKTNTILYAKNINEKFYPASTTKILTSLILLEDMPSNTIITKTPESVKNVPADSSQIGLRVGEQYNALEGIYAIMLTSDNFVSYDMAVKSAGSINSFSKKMNETAKSLGALSSHFVNPHGYHDAAHYTTPFDLAQITRAAFENPKFTDIAGTASHHFSTQNSRSILLKHTAPLLDKESPLYNSHVIGAKTGFHTPAKRTLAAKASYDNIELIGVIMKTDSPFQFEDMNALFEYGHQNYSLFTNEFNAASIINHSYSDWAEPYIHFALDANWIAPSTRNYSDTITRREFVTLLQKAFPESYSTLLDHYIDYNGFSIYNENLSLRHKDAAFICHEILSDITKMSTYVPVITDISNHALITNPYKETVKLMITTGIFIKDSININPDTPLTYQEALAMIYRLSNIISIHDAYSLKKIVSY